MITEKSYLKAKKLIVDYESEQLNKPVIMQRRENLCGFFEADNKTSSANKCKCGREKWEHPKAK